MYPDLCTYDTHTGLMGYLSSVVSNSEEDKASREVHIHQVPVDMCPLIPTDQSPSLLDEPVTDKDNQFKGKTDHRWKSRTIQQSWRIAGHHLAQRR